MKKIALIALVLIVGLPSTVLAQNMYIREILRVTLRTGPSSENKIIKVLNSGTRVEVIKTQDDWTMVRSGDGESGWMLNRYLTANIPPVVQLKRLEQKHQRLLNQTTPNVKKAAELTQEKEELTKALSSTQTELKKITAAYEKLKKESGNFLKLKDKHEKAQQKIQLQEKKITTMESRLSDELLHKSIKWFLSGGGVLFIGFLMGLGFRRKRRSSLSM